VHIFLVLLCYPERRSSVIVSGFLANNECIRGLLGDFTTSRLLKSLPAFSCPGESSLILNPTNCPLPDGRIVWDIVKYIYIIYILNDVLVFLLPLLPLEFPG
jgi:hypothetical protein